MHIKYLNQGKHKRTNSGPAQDKNNLERERKRLSFFGLKIQGLPQSALTGKTY